MAVLSLNDFCKAGGGKLAFVFHIAGMPWAATTDHRLAAALPTGSADTTVQTIRRGMLGSAGVTYDGAAHYPADDVPILPILDFDLGDQTIKYDENKGIDVGPWSVRIGRDTGGRSWTSFTPTSPLGLVGLDYLPDPWGDPDIKWGVLADDFDGGELVWDRDVGLYDLIVANQAANLPTYLWAGSSCYVIGDDVFVVDHSGGVVHHATDPGGGKVTLTTTLPHGLDVGDTVVIAGTTDYNGTHVITATTANDITFAVAYTSSQAGTWAPVDLTSTYSTVAMSRVYNTPHENIWKDRNNPNETVPIYTVPTEGVVGLPAYLYAIPMDNDGNILNATDYTSQAIPIVVRCGQVKSNPRGRPGDWEIAVGGYTEMLTVDVPVNRFTAHLSGYQFCRAPATSAAKQGTHIQVVEMYNPGSLTTNIFSAWLPDPDTGTMLVPGETCRFESLGQLKAAVVQALMSVAPGSRLFNYSLLDDGDLEFSGPLSSPGYPEYPTVYMSGPAIWACGFGYLRADSADVAIANSTSPVPGWGYSVVPQPDGHGRPPVAIRSQYADVDDNKHLSQMFWWDDEAATSVEKNRSACQYFYQFDYVEFDGEFNGGPPPASDPAPGRWHIPYDGSGNQRLYVDTTSDPSLLSENDVLSFGDPAARWSISQTTFFPVGSVERAVYLEGMVNTTSADGWITFKERGDPFAAQGDNNIYSTPSNRGPTWMGLHLFWMPAYQQTDPWVISDARSVYAEKPSLLFRALLGDNVVATTIGLPKRSRVTHVPHTQQRTTALTINNRSMIDWEKFDLYTTGSGLDSSEVILDLGKDGDDKTIKILDAMGAVLATHGARMVWEYAEADRTFWLSFAPMINESAAQVSVGNRVINNANILRGKLTDTVGGEWLYDGVEYKGATAGGNKLEFTVSHKTGRASAVSKSRKLSIVDPITKVGPSDIEALAQRLGRYARAFAFPTAAHSIDTTIEPLARLSVGRGVAVTHEGMLDPATGGRGVTTKIMALMQLRINLSDRGARLGLMLRGSQRPPLAISPALDLDAANISYAAGDITVTGLATAPADNTYWPASSVLTDLAAFDCYVDDGEGGYTLNTSCGCSDYAVIVIQRNVDTHVDANPNRNVFHGTIGTVDAAAGTCVIRLADGTNFDDTVDHVAFFEKRTSAGLQPCQTLPYGWLGDEDGMVQDHAATDSRAIAWG